MLKTPAIIITPGAWHTPRHYQRLIDRLSQHNYPAIGVRLPSVNSSPPLHTWEQDAQAVRGAIMEKLNGGLDVVAVSHSFGGIIMSEAVKGLGKASRQKQGFSTGILRLVYMCSMAIPQGQTHVGQMKAITPEEEKQEKRRRQEADISGGMRYTKDGAIIISRDAARKVFYNRCDPADVEEALDMLGSFPSGPLTVPATYTAYREIPSTYIVCENDNALPLPFQERMIAQGGGVFHVERCQEGHSPFLSNPEFVVQCIQRAAGEDV
ncbi:hypothetical protein EYZ11_004253 [Aspergillus tanneri]|uniref:AB hydrolase-1 domain-containing protein n=1 Tax=Aspergillus tanneri TaxID=1220188 RepID=A0A4S3JLJ8_9EURO|nr:uncharacterized protein ATNIH1004_010920 [Aspergillus tanneri]KAA8641981.1 hypothetical protein ATNIH1004_010920 [Aspergillus tanneri]THC96260.1 hypothetical protein EYZ11_004253 [Aspergillus tanneri]